MGGAAYSDLLVAFGVIGEVLASVIAHICQSDLTRRSNERVAQLEFEAGYANERAAKAELRTQELREKLAPRRLNHAEFQKALGGQPTGRVEVIYLGHDPECTSFAIELAAALRTAGWEVIGYWPLAQVCLGQMSRDLPDMMTVGGQPAGVTIVTASLTLEEREARQNMTLRRPWARTPYTVLYAALLKDLGALSASNGGEYAPTSGIVRITVGPKANLNP